MDTIVVARRFDLTDAQEALLDDRSDPLREVGYIDQRGFMGIGLIRFEPLPLSELCPSRAQQHGNHLRTA